MARPVLLIGTGTSVGKTYVGERVLRALGDEGHLALGYKPVESGFEPGPDSDIARLARATTFHVKPSLAVQTFAAPVSPHLAARREHRTVDVEIIRSEIRRATASDAALVLVEFPGGAFSPLTDTLSCAELARTIPGLRVILVSVDRLGVLHDVVATVRASCALGLPIDGIVLSAPEKGDDSTGLNHIELPALTSVPYLGSFPRLPVSAPISQADPARRLARFLVRASQ
jgi:dethiobiotin synthetase